MLGVFLPTISLLLSPSPSPPSSTATTAQATAAAVTTQTVAQLLAFASTSPSAFKEAIAKLDEGTRELLELSIRRAVGASGASGGAAGSAGAVKPQISLKAF